MPTRSGVRSYSLVTAPAYGVTGTGLDQIVEYIHRDPGLAGASDGKDIKAGAQAANSLNQLIVQAAKATGAAADKVFTAAEVSAMNAYLRSNFQMQWTLLHGDDEAGSETGFHRVQDDGGSTRYRGEKLIDTVADGLYHMGFEIRDARFLNEDGDPNASVGQVAEWLTQFFTDHSTSGTGLDRITDLIMADAGLDRRTSDAQIAAGADAANGLNLMLRDALSATGVARDEWISVQDVVALNRYLRADAGRLADWTRLHGDDEKCLETGFHKVQNDGATTTFFGENLANTVADGIYHLGFQIRDGHLLNEDGDRNASLSDVADWLNYFLTDASTTGTGLDRIVDLIKSDRGLARQTEAGDINQGAKAADAMNRIIVDLIGRTGAHDDGWITVEELTEINRLLRGNTALLKRWTDLHGDDEGDQVSGYHFVQGNGATTNFFGRNLVDTVGDGLYHLGFEIRDGRFLNEDGDANAALTDVATWLNFFYGQAPIMLGDEAANTIDGDERGEQINAGGGNDSISAGAGNDLVYGGWGSDRVRGGDGNDLIYGGSGNDSLEGGSGEDVFRVTGSAGCGLEGYDRYDGGAGTDRIVAYGGKVDIGLAAFGPANSVEIVDASGASGAVRLLGDWNDNLLDFSATSFVGKLSIDGGGGRDTIVGSAGDDRIDGGSWGDQTLSGGEGNDVLHGGTGTDRLSGGGGGDTFQVTGNVGSGFEGYDRYDGGAGQDRIVAYGGKVDIGLAAFGPANGVEIVDASGASGAVRLLGDWNDNLLDFSATSFVGKLSIDGGGGRDTITADFRISAGYGGRIQELAVALYFSAREVALGVVGQRTLPRSERVLRQSWLPGFPDGAQKVGEGLAILEKDGQVTYFVGGDNYFSHAVGDQASRRFALTSLMENGHVKAVELERAPLSIPHRTLMNWVGQSRKAGPSSFFRPAEPSKPRIMTPEKSADCARLLSEGKRPAEVARQVGVKESTLRKAIRRQGVPQLTPRPPERVESEAASTKSERSRADAEAAAGMGTACTRADERIQAALGVATGATTRFEASHDVAMGGLLAGLPALCANGLLTGLGRHLRLPRGFYSALHILLVLGFMALGRIKRPEHLRQTPPGELGKVIGLDRVPEVRTLREKISVLAKTGDPAAWMRELAKNWMESEPEEAGYLYVDGHVRVYHGEQANLSRRYVSRERLCLRGTTDYWVNDALGRPFFVVSQPLNDGLAETLLKDIVPQLLDMVPGQPTPAELDADPTLHRFVMVFDREGATQSLLGRLWKQRIGALTYRKNVKDLWPEDEFQDHEVRLPAGGSSRMKLAMRETRLGADANSLPVTEVRRLTQTRHQTAVITTARQLGNTTIAGRMFARWCQENYFAYMMEHYDIDGLVEYGAESLPGTHQVINPRWRELDKAVRQTRQSERKLQAELARTAPNDGGEIQKNAESVEALQAVQEELKQLLSKRKETSRKVTIDSLPEAERPTQLPPLNKILCDTIKMVAYRAETAMVALLRRHLKNEDDARALIRELFVSAADIQPNAAANTLTVKIHRMASPVHDRAIAALLDELTQQEFPHPETGAKMTFALV